MSKIQVPMDIKLHVRKKVIKKIVLWAVLTLAVLVLIMLFGERCFYRFSDFGKFVIYVLLVLIPMVSLKMYKLIDRSWYGTIEKIEIKYTTDSERSFKPTRETRYTKETVYFYVKTDGKLLVYKAYEYPANTRNISSYYRQGDKVVHIYGTDYIQIIGDRCESVICTVCGMMNPNELKECQSCHHTLKIDTEE